MDYAIAAGGIGSMPADARNVSRRRPARLLLSVIALLAATAAVVAYDWDTGKLGLYPQKLEIIPNGQTKIIKVLPGGNIQAALERATSGDIVELQAGAVYSGEIELPNKPLTDFVTIQSSAVANLPPDVRVSPEQKSSMATIVSGMLGRAAVSAANGAHHYRFVGIEFMPSGSFHNYGIVVFGKGESRPELVPHDLEIDRSYIHPFSSGVTRRGIALNSANTTIKNSYIEGIAFSGEETQGICGWTGTRNVRIVNNYIEGGAENILFGGADPASADLIPADIEVRRNQLTKPAAWVGKATLKTLFELKNAKRVTMTGNLLTNNWVGSAFRITVRDQDGRAPFSTIEDVTIRDNVINGAGEGINILGKDDTYPSQTLKRLNIINNLFLNIGGSGFDGSGYFIQIADGEDILIANNTVFNQGNITTLYGEPPRSFVFRDNIVGHGKYGVHGLGDMRSPQARDFFHNNVIVNNRQVSTSDASFPPDNFWIADYGRVGFADLAKMDVSLTAASRFKQKGREGTDIGCDVRRLPANLNGTR
jgi:hypothetical protein